MYPHHVMRRLRDGTGYSGGSVVRMRGPSRAATKGAIACLVRSIGTDSLRAALRPWFIARRFTTQHTAPITSATIPKRRCSTARSTRTDRRSSSERRRPAGYRA